MRYLLLLLLLSGCGFTRQGDAVREFVEIRAQRSADQSAENALRYLCQYARVGSVSKLFPGKESRESYATLCTGLKPIAPPSPVE